MLKQGTKLKMSMTKHDPKNKDCGLNHDFYSMCEPNCKGHSCTCVPFTCDQEELVIKHNPDGCIGCEAEAEILKEDWEDLVRLRTARAIMSVSEEEIGEEIDEMVCLVRSLLSQARADERKKIREWAEKYMEKTIMHYGTDKHGIAIEDLLEELK